VQLSALDDLGACAQDAEGVLGVEIALRGDMALDQYPTGLRRDVDRTDKQRGSAVLLGWQVRRSKAERDSAEG
jgi:hypothetical protein